MLGVVSETRSDEAPAASSGSPHLPSAELESTASGSSALAEAAALGLPALAGVVAGTEVGSPSSMRSGVLFMPIRRRVR